MFKRIDQRQNMTHAASSKFNDMLTSFDPSVESKLMHDQIANLRHINNNHSSLANIANSTAISSHGLVKPPFQPVLSSDTNLNLNTNNNNNKLASSLKPANASHSHHSSHQHHHNHNHGLAATSSSSTNHVDDTSVSNMSLAFNAYRPTRTTQSSIFYLFFEL